jgi:hypothetical protein
VVTTGNLMIDAQAQLELSAEAPSSPLSTNTPLKAP